MARRRRSADTFSLSFIDAMSCGLGAVVLLFMIINHASEVRAVDANRELAEAVRKLESEVLARRAEIERLTSARQQREAEVEQARRRLAELERLLAQAPPEPASDKAQRLARLREAVRSLEQRVAAARERAAQGGEATREIVAEGDRQYLTGLRVGGERVLLLVDSSASMLAESIVDVIRRRNLPEARRRQAPKWQWSLRIVDWISAHVPPEARFQIYRFDTVAESVLGGTTGQWLATEGGQRLGEAVRALRQTLPEGGTNLRRAFAAAGALSPLPDRIYLITDGLPTQGGRSPGGTVTPRQRMRFFEEAAEALPDGITLNILLLPMEGDPAAAGAFWRLAQRHGGTMLTPSRDWP
jgi:hypothetical protein